MLNCLSINLSMVSSAITPKQKVSLTLEEKLNKIPSPISVINSFRITGLKYVALEEDILRCAASSEFPIE